MVGTRNHPKDFPPPPTESPTKRTTRSFAATTNNVASPAKHVASPTDDTDSPSKQSAPPSMPEPRSTDFKTSSGSPVKASRTSSNHLAPPLKSEPRSTIPTTSNGGSIRQLRVSDYTSSRLRRSTPQWSHTLPSITVPWLALSLPLVIWDTGYIMLRPHTFAGGALAWPLYTPYELYGRVDPVYSPDAYYSGLGWTGAQGLGNVFETLAYFAYIWIVLAYGRSEGKGEGVFGWLGAVGEKRKVEGWYGAVGSLVGYTTFMITVAKSVLYWYNDAFMGFPIFRQNGWFNLIFVFAVPNGAWIAVPLYLSYLYGREIMEGLMIAAEGGKKTR